MKKIIISFAVCLLAGIPVNNSQKAHAHGDEDHGETKPKTNVALTDELEVTKETQFLFDITTAKAVFGNYQNTLTLPGKIMPLTNGEAKILAPQNSSIVSLSVSIGQRVGKGQILAVIEQNLGAAEQVALGREKQNAEGEYEAAKKEYERKKSLEGIVSKKELQEAEIRYKTALENKKVYEGVSYNNSKLITIKSPIEGAVDNFNLAVRQVVEQGQLLFNVFDNKKLKIEAQIFSENIGNITENTSFFVENEIARKRLPARLLTISNAVNPVNQSSHLILEVDNANNQLKPGQFINVNVMEKTDISQLIVPTAAISDINGKPVVFSHTSPETFTVRYVQLGQSNSENTVIIKGLNEDERVVTNGAYQVKSIYLNQ